MIYINEKRYLNVVYYNDIKENPNYCYHFRIKSGERN